MPPKKKTRTPKVYLYLRVSTNKQDIAMQRFGLEKWLEDRKLVVTDEYLDEGLSGTIPWQDRKVGVIVNDCQEGDIIIVPELSRLSRTMSECMTLLDLLTKKNVSIRVVKGDMTIDGSIQGKLLSFVMSLVADLERSQISERTKQALAAKKAQGIQIGGRKPGYEHKDKVLDPVREEIRKALADGIKQRFLAARYKVSTSKMSFYVKKYKLMEAPDAPEAGRPDNVNVAELAPLQAGPAPETPKPA